MKPVNKKLNKLKSNWGGFPLLGDIFNRDTFLIAIDRLNCYHITDEEKLKIQAYPLAEVHRRSRLSFQVGREIDKNLHNRIETKTHLKNYLQSIVDDMYYITDTIRGLNYIDELEKIGGFIYHDPFGYTETQIENSRLLVDFLQANLRNYQNYQMVLDHAIMCQERQGFLKPGNQPFTQNIVNPSSVIKENERLTNSLKKDIFYCINEKKIVGLYEIFNSELFEYMECADFMRCFDINNTPEIKPIYIKRQQNLMTYTLSLISNINDKIALSNFDIPNYYQMKNRPIPKSKRSFQKKIERILCNDQITVA